ncbi:tumor suppressor candidate gene 1 protein [Oxyura jamaicensis]|uniref:tumor suppressor candidate gene 1 protein n=1 Tax=Oxyura jamaicensis TaxID=8884 RepID=UPI0015A5BAC7|nr:tumor suppressor candidate gene 1 protein [Oxyura jamaicensis]
MASGAGQRHDHNRAGGTTARRPPRASMSPPAAIAPRPPRHRPKMAAASCTGCSSVAPSLPSGGQGPRPPLCIERRRRSTPLPPPAAAAAAAAAAGSALGQEGWRGQSRGSVQQLAERYADLAASHSEALRQREEREWHNVRLRQENARLRLENRRLRRENRCLFRQALLGPGPRDPDKPEAPGGEAEELRAELGRLQEKHRRALQHLRRCRAAGGPDDGELEELLLEEEKGEERPPSPPEQPLEKRGLVAPV